MFLESGNLSVSKNFDYTAVIVKEIIDLKPHLSTVFIESSGFTAKSSFFNHLISKIPVVIVDTKKIYDNQSLISPAIKLFRISLLIVF